MLIGNEPPFEKLVLVERVAIPVAGILYSLRNHKLLNNGKKGILCLLRDLDGYLSLCLARIIVWRHTRDRHPR
jgi:hypothetical protein